MVNSNVGEKNRKDLAFILAVLLVTAAVSSIILTITLQRANAYVSEEVRQTFIKDCTTESGTAPPHLDISHCPDAKGKLRNSPGGSTITNQDLNQSINTNALFNQNPDARTRVSPEVEKKFMDACSLESNSKPPHLAMDRCPIATNALINSPEAKAIPGSNNFSAVDSGLDSELTRLNNEADHLKADISSATFTPGNGEVKRLIEKAAFFSGEVSVMGGGTWTILHGVEDALISKIKESGPSSFSADEQSFIAAWANRVMTDRKEHPDFVSQVLPGFNQSP
jgi:hypothetical protein